jgi:transaldolase
MNENLKKAAELGQGIWIDSISRDDLVEDGALHTMIEDGVVGVTSNPSIFQKAISESELYDEQLEEASRETDDPKELFWELAVRDIQDACDILAPVYERTATKDGYVSLEVSPDIGYDAPKTVDEALMLHDLVDRPNLLVKIPATQPGLAAVEEVIRNGKSVNVTLIFSLERYKAVARAYIRGLQRLVAEGGDPSGVASVASFFVSRVDAEADRRLEEVGRSDLRGRLAIANAKLAYAAFEEIFSGEDWTFLESKGANKQRPLWASTSTKNPDYPDTIYVDNLIGPDTVNTMPGSTLEATMDHAEIRPTLKEGIEDVKRLPRILAEAGVDYEDVTQTLEKEGVAKFLDSFDELLDEIREKGRKLVKQ